MYVHCACTFVYSVQMLSYASPLTCFSMLSGQLWVMAAISSSENPRKRAISTQCSPRVSRKLRRSDGIVEAGEGRRGGKNGGREGKEKQERQRNINDCICNVQYR